MDELIQKELQTALERLNAVETDIKTVVTAFVGMIDKLGIPFSAFSDGSIMNHAPQIITNLMSGDLMDFDVTELSRLLPIVEKYKPLVDGILSGATSVNSQPGSYAA